MIETYPLEKAGEAFARMMSVKAEFRVVLTIFLRSRAGKEEELRVKIPRNAP